jgi:hypothetical protein
MCEGLLEIKDYDPFRPATLLSDFWCLGGCFLFSSLLYVSYILRGDYAFYKISLITYQKNIIR